jgi:radical SAM superfamily enzyme YgiQ (UPF0313 family)
MLLINPTNVDYGGAVSRFTPLMLPSSIGFLVAVLEERGYEARIWDEEIRKLDWDNLEEAVQGMAKPYIFGLSILTAQAARGYELARLLKKKFPDCKIMAGSSHPTALPEEALETGYIDYVVRGEGERVLISLYELIRRGESDPSEIMGVSFIRDGKVVNNPEAPLIKDIDSLPPFPYHRFVEFSERMDSIKKYDFGNLLSSRGCPYKCSYCSIRMMSGNTYRYRSPEKIVEELRVLVEDLGVTNVFFIDDNFCFKRRRAKELCNALKASGLGKKCNFSLQTRADNFYADLVPMLKEAGFGSVGFGMEAGTDELLKQIGKNETIEQHEKAVRLAKENGMDVGLYMIFGLPNETHEDRLEAVRAVKRMKPTHIKYNNLIPYPGTPMYRDISKTVRYKKVGVWDNFTSTLAEISASIFNRKQLPYVPESSSEWELMRDIIRYNLLATLTPEVILGVLQRKHGPGWFKLKANWFFSISELFFVAKLSIALLLNLAISILPLWPLESIMQWLKPELIRRGSKPNYKNFASSEWSKDSWEKKMQPLSDPLTTVSQLNYKSKAEMQ